MDLSQPHILRSLCHVKITKILAGSASNFVGAIDSELLAGIEAIVLTIQSTESRTLSESSLP